VYFNDKTKATLRALIDNYDLPTNIYVTVDDNGDVSIQARDQATVRRAGAVFPGIFWSKQYIESCAWWQYTGKVEPRWPNAIFGVGSPGFTVRIWACTEAPPTCQAIVEKVMVEEDVAVRWEKRTVERERIRWDCTGGTGVTPA